MELTPEQIDARLDSWPVARLATLAPDGRPHMVPIVFARHDGVLWSAIDRKPKRHAALARLRHVARHPEASVLLDRYDDDWSRLWWIRLDVDAVARPPGAGPAPEREAALAALRAKYPAYREGWLPAEATLLRLEPVRVTSWCASAGAASDPSSGSS